MTDSPEAAGKRSTVQNLLGQRDARNGMLRSKLRSKLRRKLSAPGLEPGTYGLKVRCSTN